MKLNCVAWIGFFVVHALGCQTKDVATETEAEKTVSTQQKDISFDWKPESLKKLQSLEKTIAAAHQKGCYYLKDPHWKELIDIMPNTNEKGASSSLVKFSERLNASASLLESLRSTETSNDPEPNQNLNEAVAATKDLSKGIHRILTQSTDESTPLQIDNALDNMNHAFKQLEESCHTQK